MLGALSGRWSHGHCALCFNFHKNGLCYTAVNFHSSNMLLEYITMQLRVPIEKFSASNKKLQQNHPGTGDKGKNTNYQRKGEVWSADQENLTDVRKFSDIKPNNECQR